MRVQYKQAGGLNISLAQFQTAPAHITCCCEIHSATSARYDPIRRYINCINGPHLSILCEEANNIWYKEECKERLIVETF